MTQSTDWLSHALDWYAEALKLHHVKIHVSLHRVVNDSQSIMGMCHNDVAYNSASIEFRDDIENTHDWHNTIVHELLHIKHAMIDRCLELIWSHVPESVQQLHLDTYEAMAYEPYISDMADT